MSCELDCVLFVFGYFLGIPIGGPILVGSLIYRVKHGEWLFK